MPLRPGKYYVNTTMRIEAIFTDDSGAYVDPTTVTFTTMSPARAETAYVYGTDSEMQRLSAGRYAADIVPDESGRWHYKWTTTGTGKAIVMEDDFLIQYSVFEDEDDVGYAL